MCNYMTKAEYKELKEVPDPYFGGSEGFEKVSRNFSATRYPVHAMLHARQVVILQVARAALH